jgi:site-specific DNA recombinase
MMIPVQEGERPSHRLAEVAGILALGLQRLIARQSSELMADCGDSPLHISPDQSGGGEGWLLVRDRYDDGGFSGGTLERPALKRLRADIETGKVDVVVVYKIDRLSRSLMDFSRLVEVFDQHKVTFVSVTQSFNTTTSMGRLTLNVLLSFAQFEREVIGERIRDKFTASRKRGMWMGGWAPLGYEVRDRKLVINEVDAKLVRSIFQRFLKVGSATTLARELIKENVRNKYNKLIDKGILYKLLNNPVYIGVAVHKGISYPGEHVGIIDRKVWDKVQARFQENPRRRAAATRAQTPALLKGIIFGPTGVSMSPTHTRKNGRLWLIDHFSDISDVGFNATIRRYFDDWMIEFQEFEWSIASS